MNFEQLYAPSLKELFVQKLQGMILSGELPMGEKLPSERELCQQMGVSRAVVNGGITELARQGFLEVRPRQGAYVADYRRDGNMETLMAIMDYNGGMLGKEAPLGPGSYEIACLSAGLACAAVEAVLKGELDNAYSLSRPPGHHCLPDQSMGFCFLANIPIAVERAKAQLGLGKVAIIDWDVHHGNGTQHIYLQRDDVLTISLHQDGCFPPGYAGEDDRGVGAGEGYNINIPLLAGAGDDSWRYALETIVIPALARSEPELIIIACGYDANAMDPLARMQLHSDSFRAMTEQVQQAADRLCGGKLVMVHEGGYAESYVPFCGLAVMEALSGIRTEVQDPLLEFIQQQQPRAAFAQFQRQAIDRLAQQFGLL